MNIVLGAVFLFLSIPLVMARLFRAETWTDRLLALDLLGVIVAAGLLLLKMQSGWPWNRDAVWIFVMTSFVATVGVLVSLRNSESADD